MLRALPPGISSSRCASAVIGVRAEAAACGCDPSLRNALHDAPCDRSPPPCRLDRRGICSSAGS
ncbi:hypothetical protein C884_01914 [Kocuria palustris PEL]|uniref:Uncharacterized protein n=1 Tax=Kocuria palustris PEL TaxID=1236550 RepID=M2XE83_9MICC|nr:hypothetical protein C884_01914 [Kocuria palustris PEL]